MSMLIDYMICTLKRGVFQGWPKAFYICFLARSLGFLARSLGFFGTQPRLFGTKCQIRLVILYKFVKIFFFETLKISLGKHYILGFC